MGDRRPYCALNLVEDALKMALTCGASCPPRACSTHRGTQGGFHYASAQISAFAAENGISRSMGSTGIVLEQGDGRVVLRHTQTEF
jgi:putative transposase